MKDELIDLRLRNQRLTRSTFRDPADVVAWLGAVQSQDYSGGRWGVGLRAQGLTGEAFDRAFDEGCILRTHVLRPTWHFVPRADIRWMLSLTAPRIMAASASYFRKLELDRNVLSRSRAVFTRVLRGGRHRTRAELSTALGRAGIVATGQRMAALMLHAELDQVVCSGPRRGRQFTYMLLDERAPDATTLDRDAALAELALRYFRSHGPATIRDFVWWSGLTVGEAREAISALGRSLVRAQVGEHAYWMIPSRADAPARTGSVYLLPNYDEYVVAYRDRGSITGLLTTSDLPRGIDLYAHPLVVDGLYAGTWRRQEKADGVRVSTTAFRPFKRVHARALSGQAARLGAFLDAPTVLVVRSS